MKTSGAARATAWRSRGKTGAAIAACLIVLLMPKGAAADPDNRQTLGLRGVSVPISTSAISDPWNICEREAIRRELADGLPRAIVAAVAMAESGRYNRASRTRRAWPWTINAQGRPYYFDTKAEAVRFTRNLLNSGIRSIDVGCMQVNLRYHPDAFEDLRAAFDPATNIAYAAEFLLRLHRRLGTWPDAVAHYHSGEPSRHRPYFRRVIGIWKKERARLADALYTSSTHDVATVQKAALTRDALTKDAVAKNAIAAPADTAMAKTATKDGAAPAVLDIDDRVELSAPASTVLRLSLPANLFAHDRMAEAPPPAILNDKGKEAPTRLADAGILQ